MCVCVCVETERKKVLFNQRWKTHAINKITLCLFPTPHMVYIAHVYCIIHGVYAVAGGGGEEYSIK